MKRSKRLVTALSVLVALWLSPAMSAEDTPESANSSAAAVEDTRKTTFEQAVEVRGEANTELSESQERIEELSDDTDDLFTQYQSALRLNESLRTYNRQLASLLVAQESERRSLEEQTDQVELVSREVTPLMLRMIDALDSFVGLDVPFLEQERGDRIIDLRKLMHRADVSEAEKYRRLMEAYQIETEYGRTIEAYRSILEKGDKELTVNFLRVGRIALVYQSLDESEAGVWNQDSRSWESLDGSYRTAIRQGLRIARRQAAPDLILLPLLSAKTGES
jgi:TolA-binding protein